MSDPMRKLCDSIQTRLPNFEVELYLSKQQTFEVAWDNTFPPAIIIGELLGGFAYFCSGLLWLRGNESDWEQWGMESRKRLPSRGIECAAMIPLRMRASRRSRE